MADNQVRFGFGQIFKATPDEVKKTLTVISIVIGGLITGISASNLIPMVAKVELNGWLGAALTVIHSFGAMFGVEIKSPTVPTEKVTAVKE
jgi:hypothetical protein